MDSEQVKNLEERLEALEKKYTSLQTALTLVLGPEGRALVMDENVEANIVSIVRGAEVRLWEMQAEQLGIKY